MLRSKSLNICTFCLRVYFIPSGWSSSSLLIITCIILHYSFELLMYSSVHHFFLIWIWIALYDFFIWILYLNFFIWNFSLFELLNLNFLWIFLYMNSLFEFLHMNFFFIWVALYLYVILNKEQKIKRWYFFIIFPYWSLKTI